MVFAISSYITSESFNVPNTKKHIFTMDLTGQVSAAELGSGDSQSIAPTIINTGTDKMHVFIRINCSDDGVYSFDGGDGWSAVNTGSPGEFVYGYETILAPGDSATLNGTMTVIADNKTFSELYEDALLYTVTGCAIGTDSASEEISDLYTEYLSSGGN